MKRALQIGLAGWLAVAGQLVSSSAELVWDFGRTKTGETPAGFRSAVSGEGTRGDWRVVEVPLDSAATNPVVATSLTPRAAVLAQLSQDPADERFPLLIWEQDTFTDFTFTARVKAVSGQAEQMAGLAFRIQDERNYYVLRVSALGNTVRFYKFVDGVRSPPIGVDLPVVAGVWYELAVECRGNQIRCLLNDKELFPTLTDNTFPGGRVGFFTKSDSVSQFSAARVVYTPRETLAKRMVRQAMEDYRRLVGVKLCAIPPGTNEVRVVASSVAEEVGQKAVDVEVEAVREGKVYYGRGNETVSVVLPLRDRNGEPAAAVRVTMKRFPGQTQDNVLARARPIVLQMEKRIRATKDLFE